MGKLVSTGLPGLGVGGLADRARHVGGAAQRVAVNDVLGDWSVAGADVREVIDEAAEHIAVALLEQAVRTAAVVVPVEAAADAVEQFVNE